jgi:hypothetical protein
MHSEIGPFSFAGPDKGSRAQLRLMHTTSACPQQNRRIAGQNEQSSGNRVEASVIE